MGIGKLAWVCYGVAVACVIAAVASGADMLGRRDGQIAELREQNAAKEELLCRAAERIAASTPKLHYDVGAAHIFLAMTPRLNEATAIHEYVVSILKEDDPKHFQQWEVHVVDHDNNHGERFSQHCRFGRYSVVVPDISMPAMASLCRVLQRRWGWFWPHKSSGMPTAVDKAVHYPGQADLMCVRAWHHAQTLPDWFWYERRWSEWEIEMVTALEQFEEFEVGSFDAEVWDESPWRHRPQLHRDLLGYAPSNG